MKHLVLTTIAAMLLVGCGLKTPKQSIHDAAYDGNIEVVEEWLKSNEVDLGEDEHGWTVLDYALYSQNEELINLIKESGGQSNVNKSIFVAAGVGDLDAVKKHVAAGTDINKKDTAGWTPIFYASDQKHVAEYLISLKAELNILCNDGLTPLDSAIDSNDRAVIDLLRKHGGKTGDELKAEVK